MQGTKTYQEIYCPENQGEFASFLLLCKVGPFLHSNGEQNLIADFAAQEVQYAIILLTKLLIGW